MNRQSKSAEVLWKVATGLIGRGRDMLTFFRGISNFQDRLFRDRSIRVGCLSLSKQDMLAEVPSVRQIIEARDAWMFLGTAFADDCVRGTVYRSNHQVQLEERERTNLHPAPFVQKLPFNRPNTVSMKHGANPSSLFAQFDEMVGQVGAMNHRIPETMVNGRF